MILKSNYSAPDERVRVATALNKEKASWQSSHPRNQEGVAWVHRCESERRAPLDMEKNLTLVLDGRRLRF